MKLHMTRYFLLMVINFLVKLFSLLKYFKSVSKYFFDFSAHKLCFDSSCLINFDGVILSVANDSLRINQRGFT